MLSTIPVKPLFALNKGGRGSVVLLSEGRELNTYTSFYMKEGRSYSTSVISEDPPLNRARGLDEIIHLKNRNTENPNRINKQLFRILRFDDTWVSVYQKLFMTAEGLTPSAHSNTIDDTSLIRLQKIKVEILCGNFKWSDKKKIYIPKSGRKLRYLSTLTFKDNLVQGVIKLLLEAIYEPTMSEDSHGFRPGKSKHSALITIRKNFGEVK